MEDLKILIINKIIPTYEGYVLDPNRLEKYFESKIKKGHSSCDYSAPTRHQIANFVSSFLSVNTKPARDSFSILKIDIKEIKSVLESFKAEEVCWKRTFYEVSYENFLYRFLIEVLYYTIKNKGDINLAICESLKIIDTKVIYKNFTFTNIVSDDYLEIEIDKNTKLRKLKSEEVEYYLNNELVNFYNMDSFNLEMLGIKTIEAYLQDHLFICFEDIVDYENGPTQLDFKKNILYIKNFDYNKVKKLFACLNIGLDGGCVFSQSSFSNYYSCIFNSSFYNDYMPISQNKIVKIDQKDIEVVKLLNDNLGEDRYGNYEYIFEVLSINSKLFSLEENGIEVEYKDDIHHVKKVIDLCTVLESLFIGYTEDALNKQNSLSIRAAFFISESKDEYRKNKKLIIGIYKVRNKIIHDYKNYNQALRDLNFTSIKDLRERLFSIISNSFKKHILHNVNFIGEKTKSLEKIYTQSSKNKVAVDENRVSLEEDNLYQKKL